MDISWERYLRTDIGW